MMSLWADEFQDSLEWAILPFFASQCVKLTFAELWMVSCFVLHIEVRSLIFNRLLDAYRSHRPMDIPASVQNGAIH